MELFVSFVFGILSGVMASAGYAYISERMAWIIGGYPKVKGKWRCEYIHANGQTFYEEIEMRNQFISRISGVFVSSK